jgi:4-amino-4-deoxy-L-arabinose transferase-like glycosyltransferase
MGNPRRALWRALDALWLVVLAVYVLAGVDDVPFHGDESSLIAMSRDYYYLVQKRDIEPVLYDPDPADPMDQELRLINGTVGKMAMGFAWDMAGLTAADLNKPWLWGADWEYNVSEGHVPGERLLHAARLSSAVLTAISVAAVFAIAWIAGGRPAAWAAALIYVTDPVVLLNGRRAMMEGAHLAFSTLAVLAAVWVVREQARSGWRSRRLAAGYAALGALAGLAVASKHPAILAAGLAFAAVTVQPLVARAGRASWAGWRGHGLRVIGAGLLAVAVFLFLNPAWWSDPLHMPGRVLELRSTLLDQQVAGFGGYEGLGERLEGLARQAFGLEPQYYEAPGWDEWVAGEIAQYERSILGGRAGGWGWSVLLAALTLAGAAALARRGTLGLSVLGWAGGTALVLLAVTPLEWQRYYLPLHPPLAVVAGCGVAAVAVGIIRRWRREGQHDPDRAR